MFIIAGIGSLIVWYLRKALPESPRWLEYKGRVEEARGPDAGDREGSGRRGPVASACAHPGRQAGVCIALLAATSAAAHAGRQLGARHHQHAHLRLRDIPAAVLPAPRSDHHAIFRLHAGARQRVNRGMCDRCIHVRFHWQALEHHRCLDRDHRERLDLCAASMPHPIPQSC